MDKRWNVPSPRGYRRKKILLVLSAANPNALFHRHSRLEFEARAQNTTTEARKRSSSWATADFLARFHGDRSRGRHAPLRSSRSDRAISDHRLLITSPLPSINRHDASMPVQLISPVEFYEWPTCSFHFSLSLSRFLDASFHPSARLERYFPSERIESIEISMLILVID